MSKVRSDSLYAKLTPEQRDTLLQWLVIEAVSYEIAANRMTEFWGLEASVGALCTFFSRHGFAWRLEQAKAKANDKATMLPKDFEAKKRAALAQREFEAAFQDLTTKEIIALRQLEMDEREVRLKEEIEPKKVKVAERRAASAEAMVKVQQRRLDVLEKQRADALALVSAAKNKGGVTAETLEKIEETLKLL